MTPPEGAVGIRGRSIEPWHRQVAEERGLVLAECGTSYEPDRVERREIIPGEPTCPVCWAVGPKDAGEGFARPHRSLAKPGGVTRAAR